MNYILNTVCVTYKQGIKLDLYILSFLNQTRQDTKLTVIHDGPDQEARETVNKYIPLAKPGQIVYLESETRTHGVIPGQGYGHHLRKWGMELTTEKYWKTDNADNYITPRAYEFMLAEAEKEDLDLVYSNVLHNYPNVNGLGDPAYSILDSYPILNRIDACNFIIKTDLAKRTGWNDFSTGGDGIFITQVVNWNPGIKTKKIPSALFVHN